MPEILGSAYVVLFGSFVSYLLMIVGQRHLEPSTVAAYNYIQPVIAASVGILLGVDVLTWQKVVAVLCIAAGVWAISRKSAQGKRIGVVSCKTGHTKTVLSTSNAKSSCKAALNFIDR